MVWGYYSFRGFVRHAVEVCILRLLFKVLFSSGFGVGVGV